MELLAERHRGVRGLVQLRQALHLVDGGAESPYETKTRLVLLSGGLPRPPTQIEVRNEWGVAIARIDMGWEEWKVGVEFDGAQHWTDPAATNPRHRSTRRTRSPRVDDHPGQRRHAATPAPRRRGANPQRAARRRPPALTGPPNVELLGQNPPFWPTSRRSANELRAVAGGHPLTLARRAGRRAVPERPAAQSFSTVPGEPASEVGALGHDAGRD